jgi:hypothetical protein
MGAGQSAPGGFFRAPTKANYNIPRNSFTKRVSNGFKAIRNRERRAPGSFFGNQSAPVIVGSNRGTTRKWSNFFAKGKNYISRGTRKFREVFKPVYSGPAYAPKLPTLKSLFTRPESIPASVKKAATASLTALRTGNSEDAKSAITALGAAESSVKSNPKSASAVAAALEKKKLQNGLQNMSSMINRLNRTRRV